MSIGSKLLILRALCNGKTLAFQAKDAGSIPAARSNPIPVCSSALMGDVAMCGVMSLQGGPGGGFTPPDPERSLMTEDGGSVEQAAMIRRG